MSDKLYVVKPFSIRLKISFINFLATLIAQSSGFLNTAPGTCSAVWTRAKTKAALLGVAFLATLEAARAPRAVALPGLRTRGLGMALFAAGEAAAEKPGAKSYLDH
jgi:hypothetical protein